MFGLTPPCGGLLLGLSSARRPRLRAQLGLDSVRRQLPVGDPRLLGLGGGNRRRPARVQIKCLGFHFGQLLQEAEFLLGRPQLDFRHHSRSSLPCQYGDDSERGSSAPFQIGGCAMPARPGLAACVSADSPPAPGGEWSAATWRRPVGPPPARTTWTVSGSDDLPLPHEGPRAATATLPDSRLPPVG